MNEPKILDELPPRSHGGGRGLTPNPAVPTAIKNPGKWVVYAEYKNPNSANATASRLRSGHYTSVNPEQFDAASRSTAQGGTVYIRFRGES